MAEALGEMVNLSSGTTMEQGLAEWSSRFPKLLLGNLDLPLQGALQGRGIFQAVPAVGLGQGTSV